jgi:hypothetical protein
MLELTLTLALALAVGRFAHGNLTTHSTCRFAAIQFGFHLIPTPNWPTAKYRLSQTLPPLSNMRLLSFLIALFISTPFFATDWPENCTCELWVNVEYFG